MHTSASAGPNTQTQTQDARAAPSRRARLVDPAAATDRAVPSTCAATAWRWPGLSLGRHG